MDNKDIKGGFSIPWTQSAVFVLLLAFGALFVQDAPYLSFRPPADPPRNEQAFGIQDIDARLWQDPIGVVQRARDGRTTPDPLHRHGVEALRAEIEGHAKDDVAIIAVMLRGGPHEEAVEQRRRSRYAVLAGVSAAFFAPADSDHLGWFERPDGNDAAELPEAIPYEWLQAIPDHAGKDKPRHLLLLWLDDRAFSKEPVARLAALARALAASSARQPGSAPLRIIGPGRSDLLAAMVDEGRASEGARRDNKHLHFYSATATVPDATLLPVPAASDAAPGCALARRLFDRQGIVLTRTIADDAQIANALVGELQLRGLKPAPLPAATPRDTGYDQLCRVPGAAAAPSQIAIVAEWDTLYGRSLRRPFRPEQNRPGYCTDAFKYMRGLDGVLPAAGGRGSTPKPAAADAKSDDRRKDGSFIERAEGQSQFDYLRRLAHQMHERDAELRRTRADHEGLRAIGVLGSDVHDKLLVLQALQPEFPNAVFFTTDLDARYLHPREQAWTRNLIVGSSFGLRLDDGLQAGTPPFRDSYQTAVFFTTRLLIDDLRHAQPDREVTEADGCPHEASVRWTQGDLDRWLHHPRIFEIGRTSAFDFVGRPADKPPTEPDPTLRPEERSLAAARQCRGTDWVRDCDDVHPPGSPMVPALDGFARGFVLALLLLAWVPVAITWRKGRGGLAAWFGLAGVEVGRARGMLRLSAVVVLHLVVAGAAAWSWPALAEVMTNGGKPIVITEGISLWPTEFIRVAVLLIGGYLLLRGWRGLQHNQNNITERFKFAPAREQAKQERAAVESQTTPVDRIANLFSWGSMHPRSPGADKATTSTMDEHWQRHVVQNRFGARWARALTYAVVLALPSWALFVALGEARHLPQRGELSAHVHEMLHWVVVAMLYAVFFFVVDAALLCVSFLRHLRDPDNLWPEETRRKFEQQLGFSHARLLDHWIDLQFLGERTEAINKLIYHPFILLSLMLLSRSPAFDDWTMPLAGKVLTLLGGLATLGCAMWLRDVAEKLRLDALREIDCALLQANGAAAMAARPSTVAPTASPLDPPTAKQVELLRSRVVALDDGALAAYTQQPLLKAILLPFATVGGSSLLEYLRLANL